MCKDIKEIILDINDELLRIFENNGFNIPCASCRHNDAFFNVERRNKIFELMIYGNTTQEDISCIKESEENYAYLKERDIGQKGVMLDLILGYLKSNNFDIICYSVEPTGVNDNLSVLIGFQKSGNLFEIAIFSGS